MKVDTKLKNPSLNLSQVIARKTSGMNYEVSDINQSINQKCFYSAKSMHECILKALDPIRFSSYIVHLYISKSSLPIGLE